MPIGLWAQQDTISMMQDFDEIIIQDQAIELPFSKETRSIEIISKAQIEQAAVSDVTELLSYVSGLDIRRRGARGAQSDPGLRGSTFDQVLILVNGVKMTDAQTGHHTLNLPVHIHEIERIEVLKGAGARIYGSNAFAGAINIVTKVPDESGVSVTLIGGEHNLIDLGLSASLSGEDKKVQQAIGLSYASNDGYKYNTDYKTWQLSYQASMNTAIGKWDLLAGFVERKFGANGFYASPDFMDQYEEVQTSLVALKQRWAINDNWMMKSRVYWRRNQDEYLFLRQDPAYYRNLHIGNTFGVESNAIYFSDWGQTSIGVEWHESALRSNNLGNHDRSSFVLSANQSLKIAEDFHLMFGAHANYYNDLGFFVLPGLEAGYDILDKARIFGNVSYTYRVPTFTDLYYVGPSNIGNPELEPEESFNVEIGVKTTNWKGTQLQAAWFMRDSKSLIDWSKDNEADPWQPRNLLGLTTQGIELQAGFYPGVWTSNSSYPLQSFHLGYTYIQSEEGSEAAYSRYALEHLKQQLVARVNLQYGSKVYHQISARYFDRVNLGDHVVVNTRLGADFKNWGVFVDVSNLFDEVYKETNLVEMPGRWMSGGVKFNL